MSSNILSFEEKRVYIRYLEIIFSIYLNISIFEFRMLLLRTTKYFDVAPAVILYASALNEIYGSENIRIIDIIDKITNVFFADNLENKKLFYSNIDNLFDININGVNLYYLNINDINLEYINTNLIRDNLDMNIKYELEKLFFTDRLT
jgi:hypothetical protein